MKIVGLVPFWLGNNDIRDIKKLAGRYLIEYTIELLNSSSLIDETIIYSSDNKIFDYISDDISVKHVKRPTLLDQEDISMEDIIKEFLISNDADIVVLMNPLCPFIKKDTLDDCIKKVKDQGFDSAFTALEVQKLAWFKSKPLNFELDKKTPKLKKLDRITIEQGLTYVISRDSFTKTNSRVGQNPYVKIIDYFEGHEINYEKDFEMAELIVNSGMFHGA